MQSVYAYDEAIAARAQEREDASLNVEESVTF